MIALSIEDDKTRMAAERPVSRVFTFSDGQSRMMSFSARQAAHLDGLLAEGNWTLEMFLSAPYDTARDAIEQGYETDFEDALRRAFARMMAIAWSFRRENKRLYEDARTRANLTE